MNPEIDQFMAYLRNEHNASLHTVESYGRDLKQFNGFLCGEIDGSTRDRYEVQARIESDDAVISSISNEDITAFVEFSYDCGLKRSSIERRIASIKSFFNFLYNRGYIQKNPAEKVGYPKRESRLPRFLHLNQVDAVVDFPLKTFIDHRDRAILEAFYSTGCRVSELCSADIEDVDFDSGRIKVMGKGSVERIVFLTDGTGRMIRSYLLERKKKFGSAAGPPVREQPREAHHRSRSVRHRGEARPGGGPHGPHLAAYPPAQFRDGVARPGSGHQGRPGDAGPQEPVHYPGVHAYDERAPAQGFRGLPSARLGEKKD